MKLLSPRATLLVLSAAFAVACDRATAPGGSGSAAPAPPPAAPAAGTSMGATSTASRVVARVNGVELTDLDVDLRRKNPGGGHGATPANATSQEVLNSLIRDELAAQKARSLGLDRDPAIRTRVEAAMAQVRAVERRELAEAMWRNQLRSDVLVSDADARAFFEKNADLVRSDFHVLQLLYTRDDAAANAAAAAIRGGKSFEDVAAAKFKGLPPGVARPWDLGWLSWSQVPEAWWDVLFQMKPGQVSPVIRNNEGRAWILKLVERRQGTELKFEEVKARIIATLARQRAEERRLSLFEELKQRARIEVVAPPAPAGPDDDGD